MHNRPTRYELAAKHADGRAYLICYCCGKGRRDVLAAVREPARASRLVHLAGSDDITFGKRVADGARFGGWVINFTGRTQREAIIAGELPYCGDLPEPAPAPAAV